MPAIPTIAVVANLYSDFRRPVIDHMARVLKEAGYGLLCVTGRELQHHPDSASSSIIASNRIYDLAAQYNVQGYIVISVTLGYQVEAQRIIDVVQGFKHKPTVSFGLDVPGIPSIYINNTESMCELMEHMTADPARKRFCFIRGFSNMRDSIEREAAFRQVLKRKHIAVDEDLIIEGNFMTSPSFRAMDRLLEKTQDIDAVIAGSDIMAISAIQALNKHGLSVPGDVIVSGFDDRPIATEYSPSLTTISYSFLSRATAAIECVLEQISGTHDYSSPYSYRHIDGQLMIRESSRVRNEDDDAGVLTSDDFRSQLLSNLASVKSPEGLQPEVIVNQVASMLLNGDRNSELKLLAAVHKSHNQQSDIRWWKHFCNQLGNTVRNKCIPDQTPQALSIVTSVLTQIQNTVWSVQEKTQFDNIKYLQQQDKLHIDLASCTTRAEISSTLAQAVQDFGLQRAYLVLYKTVDIIPDSEAKLLLSHDQDGTSLDHDTDFPSHEILPAEYAHQLADGLLILSPLCSGLEHLGYLLIDPSQLEPLNIDNLANSISNALANCDRMYYLREKTRALSSSNSQLTRLANFDTLTGLANRAQFLANLDRALDKAKSKNGSLALLFLDLDGFKFINDSMGHSAGDELLTIVAQRLAGRLRPYDMVARLGGDEFTVIIENVDDHTTSAEVALKILNALRAPYELNNRRVNLSASVGIASFPEDGIDSETLLQHADTAMYQAKALGKNRYCRYTPEMNNAVAVRLQLDQAMRDGLVNGDFSMHYQPRIELETNNVVGFEALMRWTPTNNAVPTGSERPEEFIKVAEETGFIKELDTFALDQACKQASYWQRMGKPTLVSVNMSVTQLQRESIVDKIALTLALHGNNPENLEIEITETAAMTDVTRNIEKLSAIRALGVQISIDDFGTGYSSMNYLKRLPVNSLKIDKSFLKGITNNNDSTPDAAIVKAVIALGKSMDFHLIAEGVENEAQCAYLLTLGCHDAQGYLFSHALNADDATQYLLKAEQQPRRLKLMK